MLHAVIMAGGGGTRFWPRSRQHRPKQFLTLGGERTLLQQARDRAEALVSPANTWVITGAAYVEETARQLPELPPDRIVGEPCRRDTAPCVGLGAALIHRADPDAVMIVMPADHVIEPAQEFRRAAQAAFQTAEEHPQALLTFGITPTFPATGYGYIHRGPPLPSRQGVAIFRVGAFEEKPPFPVAEQYFVSGEYFWNSGIFVWKAGTVLEQLRQRHPPMHDAVRRIADAWDTPKRNATLAAEFEKVTPISIDKAVMEDAPEVIVIQAPYRWDDVGSWLALERMHPQDARGNTILADHSGLETEHCVIVGEPGRLIATAGVRDLLIIQDGNATLVAHRQQEGAIKDLVEQLRSQGRKEHL